MSEHQDFDVLVDRLRRFGQQPIDPSVAATHLQMMAAVAPSPEPWWQRGRGFTGKMRVGVAVAAATLVGGSGLAFAGSLPSGVQQVAHDAFDKVGLNVPSGTTIGALKCDPIDVRGDECEPGATASGDAGSSSNGQTASSRKGAGKTRAGEQAATDLRIFPAAPGIVEAPITLPPSGPAVTADAGVRGGLLATGDVTETGPGGTGPAGTGTPGTPSATMPGVPAVAAPAVPSSTPPATTPAGKVIPGLGVGGTRPPQANGPKVTIPAGTTATTVVRGVGAGTPNLGVGNGNGNGNKPVVTTTTAPPATASGTPGFVVPAPSTTTTTVKLNGSGNGNGATGNGATGNGTTGNGTPGNGTTGNGATGNGNGVPVTTPTTVRPRRVPANPTVPPLTAGGSFGTVTVIVTPAADTLNPAAKALAATKPEKTPAKKDDSPTSTAQVALTTAQDSPTSSTSTAAGPAPR